MEQQIQTLQFCIQLFWRFCLRYFLFLFLYLFHTYLVFPIFRIQIIQQILFNQILAQSVSVCTDSIIMRSTATIIAVIAFFSGLSIDDGLASGSTEKLTAYRTADQTGEQIDPAGFGTFDIFMGDLLKFIPLFFCKVWWTVRKARYVPL